MTADASIRPASHPRLAAGRWAELSLIEQLANVGSEVGRACRERERGDTARARSALERGLELIDLTLADERWRGRRRELTRGRELVCDFLVGDNVHGSTRASLDRYYLAFAVAARRSR